MKHFLTTTDCSFKELRQLIDTAKKLKKERRTRIDLKGKTLAMVFFNPSLRTRLSFAVAMGQLGGHSQDLNVGQGMWSIEYRDGVVMNGTSVEHIKEAAKVISRYCDAIAVRSFAGMKSIDEDRADPVLNGFVRHADVPVINMESAMFHPCQALADIMTIEERFKSCKGKKLLLTWAPHPSSLPTAVPNSIVTIASQFGMEVNIASPKGFDLDNSVISFVQETCRKNKASFNIHHDQRDAFNGVDVVYAKSWGTYGKWEEEKKTRAACADWTVDASKMALTNNAKFMHCLPVRRNVIVTDEVLDSPNSIIYDEAENRLHVQKAVLLSLLR